MRVPKINFDSLNSQVAKVKSVVKHSAILINSNRFYVIFSLTNSALCVFLIQKLKEDHSTLTL